MVAWSSCDNFRAVETFAEFATISAFSSLHFCINLFSLSWDFFNALWSFSYSPRNLSRLLSPISSWRTCNDTYIMVTNSSRPLDKNTLSSIIFLISQPQHILWVLKRTISMRWFFWAPKNLFEVMDKKKIYHNSTLKKNASLDMNFIHMI